MNILRTNSSCMCAYKFAVNTEQVNAVKIKSYSRILLKKNLDSTRKIIEYLRMTETIESCDSMDVWRRQISRKSFNYIRNIYKTKYLQIKCWPFVRTTITKSKRGSCTRNIPVRHSVYRMFANGNLTLNRTRFYVGWRDTQFRPDQLKASAKLLWNIQRRLVRQASRFDATTYAWHVLINVTNGQPAYGDNAVKAQPRDVV